MDNTENQKFWSFVIVLFMMNLVYFIWLLNKGLKLNTTIREVEIHNGMISFETFDFKVFKFWKIKSKTRTGKLSGIKINRDNPTNFINKSSNECFRLILNEKESFFLDRQLSYIIDREIINKTSC